ncbi:MAG: hypothetical protein ACXQS8_09790 [Candidatus Helarchaeales archaeon]
MAVECLYEDSNSKILSKELDFSLDQAPDYRFELDQKILIEKDNKGRNIGKIIIHLNRIDSEDNVEHSEVCILEIPAGY